MIEMSHRRSTDGPKHRKGQQTITVGPVGNGYHDVAVVQRLSGEDLAALYKMAVTLFGTKATVPKLLAEAMELGVKELSDRACQILDNEYKELKDKQNAADKPKQAE